MASSLQKGINAAKAGRMEEAVEFLKDAIIEEPQNADVWVWISAIIDDLDKQEIFLEKALAIDPHNIPAQRGLAYLQKRKRDRESVRDDHLSDHTKPISPFPASGRPEKPQRDAGWSKLDLDDLNDLASADTGQGGDDDIKEKTEGFFQNLPQLSLFEIILLGVVVVVFCFIGILAASALFDINLPLGFLSANRVSLSTEPPYPGVFLYENDIYFDIQRHQGLPSQEVGIPTSFITNPLIVLWETDLDPEEINLIYETGEYIPFQTYQGRGNADLIQPEAALDPGLYCFQKLAEEPAAEAASYWCFRIDLSLVE